ncbi:MAG TPA: hypothetical protein P5315_05840 [Clostridia bacterium]|nr:hypothetical protein [Clostridia bacterium]
MRRDLLIAAQKEFLRMYPGGFSNDEMQAIAKKHKIEQTGDFARESFSIGRFDSPMDVFDNIVKILSRSSIVSVFEKAKFRDFSRIMSVDQKLRLITGLYERLHGDPKKGFDEMKEVLLEDSLAKWPLLTVIPYYYDNQNEIFIKPTTVKNVIRIFELEGVVYNSKPDYEFYESYRKEFMKMKEIVEPEVAPENGAFSGFLMMMTES